MNHEKYKVVSDYIYSPSDVLGTGTWGTVYRARLKDANSSSPQYAIKKMNKFKVEASDKSFQKYESQVVALQKACEIPQVIKIVDFFKSRSNYYIVMEYFAESRDLYEYMLQHKHKFCQQEAREVWLDLLVGIRTLHQLGIQHRDLKLQNVMYLYNQRRAKVIDFGMATCFPNPEGVVGSPMFMSPQVLSSQKYTHKCDIWSLGIIFYCMIFRSSPYHENNTAKLILEKMKQMKEKGVTFPHEIYASRGCKKVIEACLQFEEKDRPDIDEILAMPFFQKIEIPEDALDYYEPATSFRT